VHSEKAQEPLHRQALEAAIAEVYGQTFRLSFKVVPMDAPDPAPPGPAPTNGTGGRAPASTPIDTAGRGGEGLVQAAQEILGAKVVDVRSREVPGD
jgi:hypothetical protein